MSSNISVIIQHGSNYFTNNAQRIVRHVIINQDVGDPFDPSSVFPIIIAGEFGFTRPDIKGYLETLAQDKGIKREISTVLTDILGLNGNQETIQIN